MTAAHALAARARQIAADRDAGASEILARLLPVLDDATADGADAVRAVAQEVTRAQPGMAPLWNACAAAACELSTPGTFARTRAAMERAPAALGRAAAAALADLALGTPQPRLLTLSYSGAVRDALLQAAGRGPVDVAVGSPGRGSKGGGWPRSSPPPACASRSSRTPPWHRMYRRRPGWSSGQMPLAAEAGSTRSVPERSARRLPSVARRCWY